MKRFMLVSLMSCMLVGQISCNKNSCYSKGLKTALGHTAIGIGVGAGLGMLLEICASRCKTKAELFSVAPKTVGGLAYLGGFFGACCTAVSAHKQTPKNVAVVGYSDTSDRQGKISWPEYEGRKAPLWAFLATTGVGALAYRLYNLYQLPAK